MEQKKSIKIEGNGNIVIQGVNNSAITINTNDSKDVLAKLNQLDNTDLDVLAQVAEKATLGGLFDTLLSGVLNQKNIVKGSILNAQGNIMIGDNNTSVCHYTIQEKSKQSKELTLHLPRLRADQIVGRKADLKALHDRLFSQKQVVLVNGMGGIGKTTLAQVYLTEYYEEYAYIAWVGLSLDSQDFVSDFINTEGFLSRFKIKKEGKDVPQLFRELLGALKELKEKPCLLIIDNGYAQISQFFAYLPNQPHWHLLVTSRTQIPKFDLMEMGFLSPKEALELFKLHYTYSQLDDQFLLKLVETLEYHTLTIEILAKTAQDQRTSPQTLLNAIQNDLTTDIEIPHNNDAKVAKLTSYLCSIFKTTTLDENENLLLLQFLCLPPVPHTFELLKALLVQKETNNSNLSKTLNSLSKKGWLLHQTEADTYKMHRIIIDVIKNTKQLKLDDVANLVENVTLELSIDQTKDNPIDKFKWIPFGKAILHHFEDASEAIISTLQNNLAMVLEALGDYTGAKELLRKALKSAEQNFGTVHPTTAVSYSNLGLVLQALGDYTGAKELLEKALKSDEQNFGAVHPNTARCYSNLGLVLQALGDYSGAKELLEKALKSYKQNFGAAHPTTARSYSNLAIVLQALGDYIGAKKLLEKALKSDEQNFGAAHPTTAVRYSNLGSVLKALGDYSGAKKLLEKALKSNEQNFGAAHPTTAVSYSNLGLVLKALGDYVGAKDLLEKALKSDEQNFGADHPTTVRIYSNLGLVLQALGDYTGAKELLEKALKSDEQNFGAAHPNTAVRYSNLGLVLKDLGDYVGAKELLEKAYFVFKSRLGIDHPNTKIVKGNLEFVIALIEKE